MDKLRNEKSGIMAQVKKFSLAVIAAVLSSVLVIFAFTDRVSVYADKHIDERIEFKTKEICTEQQKNVKDLAKAVEEIKLVTVRLEAQVRYLESSKK